MSAAAVNWIDVCALEELPPVGARVLDRGAGVAPLAIFRCAGDSLFAVEDRCPHRGGPLSQGIVYGNRVACPLHNWSIELQTGQAVAPDQGQVRTFPVRVAAGRVWLPPQALDRGDAAPVRCSAACVR